MEETKLLPVVILSCKVFQGFIDRHIPENQRQDLIFLDYGLHAVPKKLRAAIQEQIDQLKQPSLVVLGYGLCGNGLDGIMAGDHFLLIPRTDDCIGILLGSYEAYLNQFNQEPGTYYLTKGWLESGSNPLQEYHNLAEKYGAEKAAWLMDMQYANYKRLAFVSHEQSDLDQFRKKALEVAQYCARWDMEYEELLGSTDYIQRLAEVALWLEKAGEEFIVIPPGGELKQKHFMRA